MKRFIQLFLELDSTNKTSRKEAALISYFQDAPPRDAAWVVTYLIGKRPRTAITAKHVRMAAIYAASIPPWLFEESYEAVGDLAETVSLLLDDQDRTASGSLSHWIEDRLIILRAADDQEKVTTLRGWWAELNQSGRFVLTKLITGGWRVGVSQRLVTRALAQTFDLPVDVVAHRLMGRWQPDDGFCDRLTASDTRDAEAGKPYPFFLASPLEEPPETLGDCRDWLVEWKWDGIRAQVIKRSDQVFIWSRGEELVSEQFPELVAAARALPNGTVVDGEICAYSKESSIQPTVLPFTELQRRLGRKTVGKKLLGEVPVMLLAYDLLEHGGIDIRGTACSERRNLLAALVRGINQDDIISISAEVNGASWDEFNALHQTSRERLVEGFVIKDRQSPYGVGRRRGSWWKFKVDPYTIDAVLLYAQRGHGRRASLYTDYTFGVWQDDQLITIAKAYSGLSDAEIREVDRFVRQNTIERFGPVRSVTPTLVMELSFEAIQRSSRHKSGIAVRFPRISRWRRDKKPPDADTIETIMALLPSPKR